MTAPFTRLSSALADQYRLERELGQGGMATVYLAKDLKHGRHVAIKVLHPELSAVIGGDRFLAEIRTTASLQHPHILGLIDSGEANGLLYYVMPFIEGETLRGRLTREKQLPVEDAVRLAREVAAALEFAHRRGIVHRDIKPENILLQDGQALVADFGIALAVQQAGGSRMTQTGMSLGTPAYMSPEQAMGERELGPRSDVYALGAMTYEMLAGEPPFTGPNSQANVAKVLTEAPPDLRTRRPLVSPAVEGVVLKALQKLPADRWGSAREFADALSSDRLAEARGPLAVTVPMASAVHGRPSRRGTLIAGGIAAASLALAAWALTRPRPGLPPSRLAILAPGIGGSGTNASQRQVSLAPAGDDVIYASSGPSGNARLMRRPLASEVAVPITGSDRLWSPLVSPDGRTVLALSNANGSAVLLPLDGGTPIAVARNALLSSVEAAFSPRGVAWFSTAYGGHATIGRIEGDSFVTVSDRAPGILLQMLDEETALFVQTRLGNASGPLQLLDTRSAQVTQLLGTPVVTAQAGAGYLVYVLPNGTLQAIRYNRRSRKVEGTAVTLATDVAVTGTAIAQFAVADNGTLAYVPEEPFALEFVSRDGAARPVLAERRNYHGPRFSPDGRSLSLDFNTESGRNVWLLDLEDRVPTRVSFEVDGHDATWTPDGRYLTYTVPRMTDGQLQLTLLRRRPGSAEPADTLFTSATLSFTGNWLDNGSGLLTTGADLGHGVRTADSTVGGTLADIGIVRDGGKGPLEPLIASRFVEMYPFPSPDGKRLAFVSDQSGREEVYVRDISGKGAQVRVSNDGGTEPVWSKDGREIFYLETRPDSAYMVAASVTSTPTFRVLTRKRLFPSTRLVNTNPHAGYDVSADGKTFVVVRRSPSARIVVIQNFPALIARQKGQVAR